MLRLSKSSSSGTAGGMHELFIKYCRIILGGSGDLVRFYVPCFES